MSWLTWFGCRASVLLLLLVDQGGAQSLPTLPDSPGKDLIVRYCTACHGMNRVMNAGGTQQGWHERIERMNRWGARIPAADIAPMAQFLAAKLPPRVRPPTSSSITLGTSVSPAAMHPVQTVVRAAGERAVDGRLVAVVAPGPTAQLLEPGQRARVFTPSTRFAFQQARVAEVSRSGAGVRVTLSGAGGSGFSAAGYVVEIVVERGVFLCVPNEAIIEEAERRIVYLRRSDDYMPREIRVGIVGERYTQVVDGLQSGDEVVTLGGFFVDAQYRMRSADP